MLGPYGSSKVTCLRLIADFNSFPAGLSLSLVNPPAISHPWGRGMIFFQDYALFPHMSIL